VVSVPPEESLSAVAKAALNKHLFGIRTIVVNSEEDKFAAMCASDIGLAVNGQIVAECAGLQLPTVILYNQYNTRSYLIVNPSSRATIAHSGTASALTSTSASEA
jgi:lipid A disaccharide synthetase